MGRASYLPWVYTSDNGLYLRRTADGTWVISPTIDGADDYLAKDDASSGAFCPEHVHEWAVYNADASSWLTPANSGGVTSQCTCCDAILFSAMGVSQQTPQTLAYPFAPSPTIDQLECAAYDRSTPASACTASARR